MLRILGLTASLAAPAAHAQDLESMMRASELATVIGSETLCSLTLDQPGIETWIAKNVAPDDLSFASQLQTMTMGQEHCAAVRQTAKAMGLIK
jgi:hypothetical protein